MVPLNRVSLVLLLVVGCRGLAPSTEPERVRYLRVTSRGAIPECSFTLDRDERGWSITSVTGNLSVSARYDASDALVEATALLGSGDSAEVARAEGSGGRARVFRTGRGPEEVDAPRGIIVTSAPDWTDAFRICRLWKRSTPGRQEFPGLWIHPVQPLQRLTFTAERAGGDAVDHGARPLELDRLSIRLRGNSPYLAWVDAAGRMIKLVALPAGEGSIVLVLEGFEKTAAALKPG